MCMGAYLAVPGVLVGCSSEPGGQFVEFVDTLKKGFSDSEDSNIGAGPGRVR